MYTTDIQKDVLTDSKWNQNVSTNTQNGKQNINNICIPSVFAMCRLEPCRVVRQGRSSADQTQLHLIPLIIILARLSKQHIRVFRTILKTW